MHGRLKVKTTAEQQEAKRIEREKKVKKYTAATHRIFQKRQLGEKDQECIDITGQVLSSNPDFYTLWNIRRETFLDWNDNRSEDDMQEVYESELGFLEQCLRVNPKSYGSWQHRCWVMENMPRPNWKKELQLCNQYLEYDERNFHCWDYRRFVVQKSGVDAESEFQYTTDKISSNFSNYSSWHYRSKLMPLIHPDPDHPVGVKESILLQEFELAQNAFFTDPNDQSAWFYHRWLLGRGERKLCIECVITERKRAVIVLNKEPQDKALLINLKVDETEIPVTPKPLSNSLYSKIWEVPISEELLSRDVDHSIAVSLVGVDCSVELTLREKNSDVVWRKPYKTGARFNYELSAATSDILKQELDSCEQLHDLEPDNKWTLLTIVLLMRAVDPLKYEEETMNYLSKLEVVDKTRQQYYRDMRSKFIIENAIERLPESSRSLCLSGLNLSCLYHTECFAHLENIDISNNNISEIKDVYYLQCMNHFKADAVVLELNSENLKCLPNLIA